jgi:hypothetical protein
VCDFVSEDALDTFEGWIKYQGFEAAALSAADLEMWKSMYLDVKQRVAETPKVGRMKLPDAPNEFRIAVALEDNGLWLTLWVKRSAKGEIFVLLPRGKKEWDAHTSYHADGTRHTKSHGLKFLTTKRQPPGFQFHGTESLGTFYGHGPKKVGAICDPNAFNAVVKVPPGVLGPWQGGVQVDLVEPGLEPPSAPWETIFTRDIFKDVVPWISITIGPGARVA